MSQVIIHFPVITTVDSCNLYSIFLSSPMLPPGDLPPLTSSRSILDLKPMMLACKTQNGASIPKHCEPIQINTNHVLNAVLVSWADIPLNTKKVIGKVHYRRSGQVWVFVGLNRWLYNYKCKGFEWSVLII